MNRPARLIISYSHKDERFRSELLSALSPAIRAGEIDVWSDHRIVPGQDIDDEIMAQLKEADAIVLLVSHDFVASDYCFKKELEVALERHKNERAVVVPVVIRPTDYQGLSFARLKMLPSDAKAISTWRNEDEAWLSVAHGLREAVRQLPETMQEPSEFKSSNIREHLRASFDRLQERFEDPEKFSEHATPFKSLNKLVGGTSPKETVLLAGRPGSGFVEMATSMVMFAAIKHKKKILVLSQRFSSQTYVNKLLCSAAFVTYADLQTGQLDDESWSRITSGIRLLKDSDITIHDEAIRSLDDLTKKLSSVESLSFDMIVLDGLEYLSNGAHQSEKAIAFCLGDLSREGSVAVICTLSLGHHIDTRSYRLPLVSDLDEWIGFESASHKILLTFRQDLYELNGHDYGQISEFNVNVAKNVDGMVGNTTLRLHTFSGAVTDSLIDDDQPA